MSKFIFLDNNQMVNIDEVVTIYKTTKRKYADYCGWYNASIYMLVLKNAGSIEITYEDVQKLKEVLD